MRPSAGQNTQNLQGYPPQNAQEHPADTRKTRVPSRTDLALIPRSDRGISLPKRHVPKTPAQAA
eukprot:9493044-Pyramimonas_sp.AAC.1